MSALIVANAAFEGKTSGLRNPEPIQSLVARGEFPARGRAACGPTRAGAGRFFTERLPRAVASRFRAQRSLPN